MNNRIIFFFFLNMCVPVCVLVCVSRVEFGIHTFGLANSSNFSYTVMTQSFHKVCSVRHYEGQLYKSNLTCVTPLEQLKPISDIKGRAHLLFPFQSFHQRSQGGTESGHKRGIPCIAAPTLIFSESSPSV